jgi:ketosteroid isomerase-like protein
MNVCIAVLLAVGAQAAPSKDAAQQEALRQTVAAYNQAMRQRSVEDLAAVVDDDLIVLEGVHKNVGWPDYRDNHIGPEMAEWTQLRSSTPIVSVAAASGDLAYVVQESTLTIVTAKGETTLATAETFVLRRRPGAPWRIVHVHFSGKKKEAGGPK